MRIEADWLANPALRAVVDALDGAVYFVGGCVRDTLLGRPVADIDLTTPLAPVEVTRLLEAAGLKAVPTGIDHCTVTAVSGGEGFEITTFRADVSTDGRRATVRFSTSIAEDAARRDFTMNAIYARPDGEIIDPLGGLPDLRARRVCFIGDPHDRIREDYLRILRFFRFTAWFGRDGVEPEGLAACAELAEGIERLARERIGAEIRKLLCAPDPALAVAAMAASGVLARCLPGANAVLLAPLIHFEAEVGGDADWLVRLAALGGEDAGDSLRLSRADAGALAKINGLLAQPVPIATAAHEHGARAARGFALLSAAMGDTSRPVDVDALIARGLAAKFPLRAADLMAAGVAPGPALGRGLEAARQRWLASGFSLDKAALLAEIEDIGHKS